MYVFPKDGELHQHGLEVRGLFAAMALQGLLASGKYLSLGHETVVDTAIDYAKELIRQLENKR